MSNNTGPGASGFSYGELIYEWNSHSAKQPPISPDLELVDETLRDGLQSPSAFSPSLDDRIQLVRYMDDLGIDLVDIGLPGAGEKHYLESLDLACLISGEKLKIRMSCAARTVIEDIVPVAKISQACGRQISAYCFIGTSPIRQIAEDWSIDRIKKNVVTAIEFALKENLDAVLVLEDTTRTPPETLDEIYTAGIEAGASCICVCDTVGYANPEGVDAVIKYTLDVIKRSGRDLKVDFHGHNDRGLATINAMQAARSGAHRVHGCAVGIGERVGNCSMEQILVNLELEGFGRRDLKSLFAYARLASKMTKYPIPVSAPIVGRDAFRTGTGVHAAAIVKAEAKGDAYLADRVYSSVPASLIGRKQIIEVGHMSGKSNVRYWLLRRGIEPDDDLVNEILEMAKKHDRLLSMKDIDKVIARYTAQKKTAQPRA